MIVQINSRGNEEIQQTMHSREQNLAFEKRVDKHDIVKQSRSRMIKARTSNGKTESLERTIPESRNDPP